MDRLHLAIVFSQVSLLRIQRQFVVHIHSFFFFSFFLNAFFELSLINKKTRKIINSRSGKPLKEVVE